VTIANIYSGKERVMGQASVLNESEIRRVFRIIETTRHVERNRLCFVLSLYSGLRVGEIAARTIGDVAISRELSRNKLPSGRYSPLHAAGAQAA
jgi:integrase